MSNLSNSNLHIDNLSLCAIQMKTSKMRILHRKEEFIQQVITYQAYRACQVNINFDGVKELTSK